MTTNPHQATALRAAGFILAGLLCGAVQAEEATAAATTATTPATPTKAPEKDDSVVELSPFEVNAGRDNGYYGANTLSGTRLNSRVQDLGGSITVVTKQQLDDTASLDINDIFRYEANTEGTYNYTATSSSTPTSDLIQGGSATASGPALATRVRGLSAPNVTVDYFTHTARIPIDSYFADSIEISRGPNSTVAGLGSPSGTINTNLSPANLTRNTNQTQLRVDDLGSWRTSLNFNRILWRDRLAIRVAALYSDQKFAQKPSYDYTRRLYAAVTAKPFKSTTIHAKAEVYHEDRQAPNSLTPRDGVSEWLAAGKPTWNPLTWTATTSGGALVLPVSTDNTTTFPNGLYVNTNTYTRPTMYISGGQVQLWEVNRLATTADPNSATTSNARMISSGSAYMRGTVNSGTLYNVPGIHDKSLYDWTSVNAVPTNWNYDRAATYTAEIEQKIIENLYFRGAWHLEDSVEYNRNITNPPTLQIDVNQYLLDGKTNPNFLRPYISSIEPSIFRLPEYNDAKQAALTYSIDATHQRGLVSWLGRHQIGANYENRRVTQGTFRYREAITDPNHVWLTAGSLNYTNGAAIGRPNYVYYVGPTGATGYTKGYAAPKSGVEGNFNLNWYNGATGTWVSDPTKFGVSPYVSSLTRQETTTRSATWQGNFLKDHLVITGGLRKDAYRTRNSSTGAVIDGSTGFYTYDALKNWAPWTYAKGPTRMFSAVLYPLKSQMIGLTYSRSSSFVPQAQAVDLFGNVLPNTYGHGQDVGFFMNLLDGKLVFSFKVYKTTVSNDRTSNSTIGSRIARIEAGMLLPSTSADTFSLYNFAQTVAKTRLGGEATQAQIDTEAAKITQFPAGFQSAVTANTAGAAIRGTADTEAKGAEMELTYNPVYNWNIKFSGAQTESINKTIENNLQDYINSRLSYWQSVKDDSGNSWWTSTALNTQSASAFYSSAVVIPLKLDQALLGKSNPQVKKYTWRVLSTYRFTQGRLNGFLVGGSARWDDKSVIGYLGGGADSDGIVRTLDINKPYYDKARYQYDLWTAYNFKFDHDRIHARVQLNLNNVLENGGLRVVGINPDGQPYNYRIINPRQFVLTTTFDF